MAIHKSLPGASDQVSSIEASTVETEDQWAPDTDDAGAGEDPKEAKPRTVRRRTTTTVVEEVEPRRLWPAASPVREASVLEDAEPRAPRPATMSIQEAAKFLGIGRNQAYSGARNGEIPTIKIGKRLLVPTAALERLLRGDAA